MQESNKAEVKLEEGKNYSLAYIMAYLSEEGNENKFIVAHPDGESTDVLIHDLHGSMPVFGSSVFYPKGASLCKTNNTSITDRMTIVKVYALGNNIY